MRDDRVYLQDIRDTIEDITAYCGNDHDAFLTDRMRQDAMLKMVKIDVAELERAARGEPVGAAG